MATNEEPLVTMAEVDARYQQLGCLGHGGFGSVFLAQKRRSGRKVALKFIRIGIDDNEEVIHKNFRREVDSVLKLDCTTDNEGNQDLSIVYFKDWFRGINFAAVVMQYASGGTLAMEIDRKDQPYTERRILWYALQLTEALAYAHSRGVTHYDVKGSNVLIDSAAGGKLLLADFGSAVSPGEEAEGFTKLYAAPELLIASENDDLSGLENEKVDAFGLGCILFELICCKRLVDFAGEMTLAQFLRNERTADAALDLGDVRFPWMGDTQQPNQCAYSKNLRLLIKGYLEPDPAGRQTPAFFQKPLRQEGSPLLADHCSAAWLPQPGADVTIDNIQLGMFVQRGRHWNDGNADGGMGSIGVVVRLDPDAQYTEVAFPSRTNLDPKPIFCRIGANKKFELQVGPTPMNNFFEGPSNPKGLTGGIIYGADTKQHHVGQMINASCTVVAVNREKGCIMIAPMEKIRVPALQIDPPDTDEPIFDSKPPKPMPLPTTWDTGLGQMISLPHGAERELVVEAFYASGGGMDIQQQEIVSIMAVQSEPMWEAFAKCNQDIQMQNWGVANQRRLFHGTGANSPESLLATLEGFYQACSRVTGTDEILFSSATSFGDRYSHRSQDGRMKQIILSRVALGRIKNSNENGSLPLSYNLEYHSVQRSGQHGMRGTVFAIQNPFQAYPEFVITYKTIRLPGRRIVRARRSPGNRRTNRAVPTRPIQTPSPVAAARMTSPHSSPAQNNTTNGSQHAATPNPGVACATPPSSCRVKMCVVCLEKPVSKVLIPCGHPCLCEVCSTKQGLRKLKMSCPECRTPIKGANKFFGKVVED